MSDDSPESVPVFLAYRRADGERYARLAHANLNGKSFRAGEGSPPRRLDVFCDLFTPPTEDFTQYNTPALQRAAPCC